MCIHELVLFIAESRSAVHMYHCLLYPLSVEGLVGMFPVFDDAEEGCYEHSHVGFCGNKNMFPVWIAASYSKCMLNFIRNFQNCLPT